MAGSWCHATTPSGRLLCSDKFAQRVENLGDAYETAEEMYGMVCYLADRYAAGYAPRDRAAVRRRLVADAQGNWKAGLKAGGVSQCQECR